MHLSRNVEIHIRTLDTGGFHDCANSDSLSHDFGDKFSAKVLPPRISLCGKTVAVLFQTQTERKETTPREDILLDALVVWNWHTGGKLYVSFVFLPPASLRLRIIHTFYPTLVGVG